MFMQIRKVVGHTILHLRRRTAQRFHAATHRARSLQREVLDEKLSRHADSDFGRVHRFREIRSPADFRRRVPLTDYSYFEPYIERVKEGETQALFGSGTKLLMMALTSGTTDRPKFIPITEQFLREYRHGWYVWGAHLYDDHPRMRDAHILQLASDWEQFRTAGGVPCGNISGLASQTQSAVTKVVYAVPPAVTKIPDSTAKSYTALRLAITRRCMGMALTANPSTLILLAQLGDQMKEHLVRDLADGTLTAAVEVPTSVRERLARRIRRRQRARARELEAVINRTGRLYPKDYWPTLALLAVWTGGSVGPYLRELPRYFGDIPVRDHGLSASEGRMTLPFEDFTCAGVLDVTSHYYEFIPQVEHGSADPTVLEAHQLVEGRNYFILLTTSSGLYRYDIHDLVRCVGFEGEAPVLEFLNKGDYFSSVTGEKLSEFQVVDAVRRSLNELGVTLGTFTAAPVWDDPPHYVLLAEESAFNMARRSDTGRPIASRDSADVPPPNRVDGSHPHRFAEVLDRHLQAMNMEYANRRETRRLGPIRLHLLPTGTWHRYRDQRLAHGGSLEQYKHPCLVSDLEFVAKLTATFPLRRLDPSATPAAESGDGLFAEEAKSPQER